MATSGLILMARNKDTQRLLSMMFEKRQINKAYIAIVDGKLKLQRGEINQPLITDWPNRPLQKIDHDIGKPALTTYKVIEYNEINNTSRVELIPQTGRTHQLRVHMQVIGHAILGDGLYATKPIQQKSNRLLLHAQYLAFAHPDKGVHINFSNKVPF